MRGFTRAMIGSGAILTMGCADAGPSAPRGPPVSFARVVLLDGGGFESAGNVGTLSGSQWHPIGWTFIPGFGVGADGPRFEGDINCPTQGLCAVGDLRTSFGTLGPAPVGELLEGAPEPTIPFGVISTTNFIRFDVPYVTLASGIQRSFQLPQDGALELSMDYAFLTGQLGTGPAHDDYALVELLADEDRAEVLRVSRDDFQPGGSGEVTGIPGGCGSAGMGGVTSEYPICSGWVLHRFPVPALFMGRSVIVRVTVVQPGGVVVPVTLTDEAGVPFQTTQPQDNGLTTSLAIDNVRFERPDEDPNLAPIAEILETQGGEGSPISVRATSSDPDGEIASFDWGAPPACVLSSEIRTRAVLTCPDDGSYLVSYSVTDNGGRSTTVLRRIDIRNVAPIFESDLEGVPAVTRAGSNFTAAIRFSDRGVFDTHTATWRFSSLAAIPGTVFPASANDFARVEDVLQAPGAGMWNLRLQVVDDDGGQRGLTRSVAVFDPAAGSIAGNAFGYLYGTPVNVTANVAYPDANALLPSGVLTITAPAKGIDHFEATSFEYLVISGGGTRARISGTGIRNGIPGYGFTVEIIDRLGTLKPVQVRFTVEELGVPKGFLYESEFFSAESGDLAIVAP